MTACSKSDAKQRHFERGQAFLAASKAPEAIIEFRNALTYDERWGEARLKLAEAYAANASPALAYKEYLRAADLLPDSEEAQLKAAAYLLLAGQYEDARARTDRVLAAHPDNADAQIARGNALAGLRDFDGAMQQLAKAVAGQPTRSEGYVSIARVQMARGANADAAAAFDRAIAVDPRSVVAHLARANFQWSIGHGDEAERSLKQVLEIDSNNLLARRALAALYIAIGREAQAREHLEYIATTTKTPEAAFALADYHMAARRFDEARKVLAPLAAATASSADAETRLAHIAYLVDGPAAGHRLLDEVLKRAPQDSAALVLDAGWQLDEGHPAPALQRADAALAVSPDLVDAMYIRAEAQTRLRRYAEAVQSFIDILRVNPRDAEAQSQLSALYLTRNEPDSAVHAAEEALTNAPESVGARLALARALIARGDLQSAASELERARKGQPANSSADVIEGTLKMRAGRLKDALVSYERALERDPGSREALIGATTVDVLLRNVDRASQRLAGRDAADPEILRLDAKVALAGGDLARAEQSLRRAVSLDPLDVEAPTLLVRLLTMSGKLDQAFATYDATLRTDAADLGAGIMAALICHTQGKLADAQSRYIEVLRREPRIAIAANNLAALYLESGENLKQAQELAERAVDLYPRHAGMRDTLGTVYLKRQLPGPALNQFRQSVQAEPTNPLYWEHLGAAYVQSGDQSKAQDALQRAAALRLPTNHPPSGRQGQKIPSISPSS